MEKKKSRRRKNENKCQGYFKKMGEKYKTIDWPDEFGRMLLTEKKTHKIVGIHYSKAPGRPEHYFLRRSYAKFIKESKLKKIGPENKDN